MPANIPISGETLTPPLTLPLPAQSLPMQRAANTNGSIPDFFAAKVVVIGQGIAMANVICGELSRAGFSEMKSFDDPNESIDYIAENQVDIIILEFAPPAQTGISVLRHLRAQRATQFVPVMVVAESKDLQTRIDAFSAGANDYLTKDVQASELAERVKNALFQRAYSDLIERKVATVERELRTDDLTGLNNRRSFDEKFQQVSQTSRHGELSLVLFDVDHFKSTNDSFGHEAGDRVLQRVAEIVHYECNANEFAARIGGDEFAIICNHRNPDRPRELCETIRGRVFAEPTPLNRNLIKTTISMGIATYGPKLADMESLMSKADAALYQSKRQGRNTINVYSDSATVSIGHSHLTHLPDPTDHREALEDPRSGHILIVDDEPAVTQVLELNLRKSGYKHIAVEHDARNVIVRVQQTRPDLVILDIRMPNINGLEILRSIKNDSTTASIPVLIMTSTNDEKIRMASLKLQASDFVTKPANPAELDARVFNSMKLKQQHDQLLSFSQRLKHEIEIRTSELFATRRETILCLARAAEARDTDTGNHVIRVGHYAAIISRQLGMDDDTVGWIELAAQLHDVGKLSIPDAVLLKPGKLTLEERRVIETHCDQADRIFFGNSSQVEKATITSPLLKMAARIATSHHEKWDGTGYPNGLAGEAIPIEGRVTAVADVFDALSSKRAYKDAFEPNVCFEMIQRERGKHFDPAVVDAFLSVQPEILAAMRQWQDPASTPNAT